ncbi:hypothetical protein C0995_009670 [Termitomyces sp. Mi166|nr:hypothetical protein C0995_009670 [Termitomyces sp. Mi166\
MSQHWQDLAASKKSRQQASIPKDWILTNLPPSSELDVLTFPETCGLLTPQEVEITNTHVDVLLKKLASAEWTSVAVMTAFGKRAIVAHQLVGTTLLAHEYRSEHGVVLSLLVSSTSQDELALVRAVELDAYLKTTGTTIGPLHGYASWVGKYAERNAVLVDVLEGLGAVLSIRIPSSFCGTYGFRPSVGRVPYAGSINSLDGEDTIPSVLGPLSNSIHGVKVFIQGVLSQKSWFKDPLVIRKGWSEEQYNLSEHGRGKNLCFAIMWNDGEVVPHPPIIRGLEMAKNALIKAGHKACLPPVIDWKPPDHKTMLDVGLSIFSAGAAEDFAAVSAESGEPLVTSMVPGKEITDIDPFMLLTKASLSAYELWQCQKKKIDLRQDYLAYWISTVSETATGRPVDAIIAPVAPFTAVPHGKNSYLGYTMVWNFLDWPAVVIPASRVDPALDIKKPAHEFLSDLDKMIYELYEPEIFEDAPIGFQIVGMTQEDEAVIAMAEIVDVALKAL